MNFQNLSEFVFFSLVQLIQCTFPIKTNTLSQPHGYVFQYRAVQSQPVCLGI